jgi:hypothetical protein
LSAFATDPSKPRAPSHTPPLFYASERGGPQLLSGPGLHELERRESEEGNQPGNCRKAKRSKP